jgi:Zn-dependent metalloprotease
MVRAGDLRLAQVADDTLMAGHTHERLDQYYQGVRVFGGNTVRQMAQGQAVSIFSQLYTDISLDSTPLLTKDDARTAVEGLSVGSTSDEPELVALGRHLCACLSSPRENSNGSCRLLCERADR